MGADSDCVLPFPRLKHLWLKHVFEDYVAHSSQHIVLRVLGESLPVKLADTRERLNAVVEALGRVILK
jgi:hypothetical protein